MYDIDDIISDQEENETGISGNNTARKESLDDILMGPEDNDEKAESSSDQERTPVGKVEKFFSKIKVAAISLNASIKVGDTIEIEGADGPVVLKVSGMQINKEDVQEASEGDSIGIKLDKQVNAGSNVYLID